MKAAASSRATGRLFVWEGPDEVGKTTTLQLVRSSLEMAGYPVEHLSFPGTDPGTLGGLVYDLHHGRRPELHRPTPFALQALHVAAHIDAVESRILPALRRGTCVLLDRYWWSTWIYGRQAGVSREALTLLLGSELHAWDKTQPTAIFLLSRRSADPAIAAEYDVLASTQAGTTTIHHIENEATPEDAAQRIFSLISTHLPSSKHSRDSVPVKRQRSPLVFTRLEPAKVSAVYDTYWKFAAERQSVFFRRLRNDWPLTSDPILRQYKFTNAYRASDRVSQFLIRNVAYSGSQTPREVFFRILLFKLFNKIDTWTLLTKHLGALSYERFELDGYDRVLREAIVRGDRIYSAAYIMPTAPGFKEEARKHTTHLRWLVDRIAERLPERLGEAKSMREAFDLLRATPMLGNFLAYQFLIDLNYSTLLDFSESEFVIPGPGARDGLRKCFTDTGGLTESDLIRIVADRQDLEFGRLEIDFQSLWGRPLQLIDCQNVFCEVDKYARIAHPEVAGISGRTRIKQQFQPSREPVEYWYPPKWGINQLVTQDVTEARRGSA